MTVSKQSPTQPYIIPLRPLLNPKFTLPQEVSQPSSRWDLCVEHHLKRYYRHLTLAMIAINTKKTEHLSQVTNCKKIFEIFLSFTRSSIGSSPAQCQASSDIVRHVQSPPYRMKSFNRVMSDNKKDYSLIARKDKSVSSPL